MTRRGRARGSSTMEIIVMLGMFGIGTAAILASTGARLHQMYRQDRLAVGSPYP